jgi:phosphoglycolate phosphatase-like HAD superfamily hydrolase
MTVDAHEDRRFKHVFLDAEGTLYVPHRGRSTWEFWADPSPEHAKDFFVLDEGVGEALIALRSRVDTLCIASKNSKPILDELLNDFGIRECFDEVLINGNKGKQISKYLSQRGLDRRDAVMVGDTPELDVFPLRRAGIEAILVDRPYNRWADAERIKGVRELPSWLRIADLAEAGSRPRNSTLDDFLGPRPAETKRLISITGC